MSKKRKIWDIIADIEENEQLIHYHQTQVRRLAEELEGRRLNQEQKEALYWNSDEAAYILKIEM